MPTYSACIMPAYLMQVFISSYFKPDLAVLQLNMYFTCTALCLLKAVAFTLFLIKWLLYLVNAKVIYINALSVVLV